MVLDFTSANLKSVTVNRGDFEIYNKCDTCKNWIIDTYNDTIFNHIVVKFRRKEPDLIESILYNDGTSSRTYTPCDINSVYWNEVNYFKIQPDIITKSNNPYIRECDEFLGYYRIKGYASLIKYASFSEKNNFSAGSFPGENGTTINSHPGSYAYKSFDYCIEINLEMIKIPKTNKKFRITMMNLLANDRALVSRIKAKEFKYNDIHDLVNIYNKNLK